MNQLLKIINLILYQNVLGLDVIKFRSSNVNRRQMLLIKKIETVKTIFFFSRDVNLGTTTTRILYVLYMS